MKRNIYFLLMTLLVAMMSFGLSSCIKDDDEDGGSGGGNKAAVVDGKAYNMKYAWWKVGGSKYHKTLTLEFSNIDLYDRDYIYAQPQIRGWFIDLEIDNYEYSDVQPGTYTAGLLFQDETAKGYSYETHEWQSVKSNAYFDGTVTIIITKEGDNFTITIPETMLDSWDVNTDSDVYTGKKAGSVPFSFTYKGKISVAGDWEN